MTNISVKVNTKDSEFVNGKCSQVLDFYSIFKDAKLVWRCRNTECFKSSQPETFFNAEEIYAVVKILASIEAEKDFNLAGACLFFEWGFIWQISNKGQRPQIYCPYGLKTSTINDDYAGNVYIFENVGIKTEKKSSDYGDLRDLFGSRSNVTFKLKSGNNKFIVTRNANSEHLKNVKEIAKVTTTNGGGHHIYFAYV